MRTVKNDPNAARLIEGMRDTGYEFKTAVADIVDNSIAAKAKSIEISMHMDPRGEVSLYILDDGIGMTEDELIDAMQYGASKKSNPLSLGKFGLGLKTASTAFCRELSVVTIDLDGIAHKAVWDLDHVVQKNKWLLMVGDPNKKELNMLCALTKGKSGTMVAWRKVDRLLKKYKMPGGRSANNAFSRYITELKEHIAMVFQRFIDEDDDRVAKKIKINLNNETITPWNPFRYADLSSEDTPEVTEESNGQTKKIGNFHLRAFYFPHSDDMTDEVKDYTKISLPRQGIYIYRENRMIYGPDWLGGETRHNSLNRVRVELSFDHRLDDLFQIDVKKSQVILTEELHEYTFSQFLKSLLSSAIRESKKSNRMQNQRKNDGIHDPSNVSLRRKEGDIPHSKVSIDPNTGNPSVSNVHGEIPAKFIHISSPNRPGENFVQPVESIVDGLLWEPALINGHNAVRINTSHLYYQRVYSQIRDNPDIVKGLDYLLWALIQAELNAMNENAEQYINEYRYEVSRILRLLANDLPEPEPN